jgi:L-ornithine N5-oxygenase
MAASHIYDILGIGYGPANLAASVAIADHNARANGPHLSAAFIEAHPSFLWHPGMMIEGSRMQISCVERRSPT